MSDDRLEEWRIVPRYEDYEVSNLGRIRRCGSPRQGVILGRILRLQNNSCGYLQVHLIAEVGKRKTVLVHQAVAAAFCGGWPENNHKITPAHWDGDKKNNRASNLRWATRPDNYFDKLRHGRATHGQRNGAAKLTDESVDALRKERAGGASLSDLSTKYGVSTEQVSRIATGKSRRVVSYYGPVAVEDYFAARS